MTCSLCEKPVLALGFCSKHYTRAKNHGSPHVVKSPRGKAQAFIRSVPETDECVSWPFRSHYSNGYGAVTFNGSLTGAHRAVCEIYHGPPGEGKEAAHSCGSRSCVNPRHIRWATPSENAADKHEHGTANNGEANPRAKLTWENVRAIRALGGKVTQEKIAALYGVSRRAVGMILQGTTWKEVPDA